MGVITNCGRLSKIFQICSMDADNLSLTCHRNKIVSWFICGNWRSFSCYQPKFPFIIRTINLMCSKRVFWTHFSGIDNCWQLTNAHLFNSVSMVNCFIITYKFSVEICLGCSKSVSEERRPDLFSIHHCEELIKCSLSRYSLKQIGF